MHSVKSEQGWSKSELAAEFDIDRRTVDKVLKGITAAGAASTARHPTYRIVDVAYPLGAYKAHGTMLQIGAGQNATIGFSDGQIHPDELPPKERKEWYDGEKVRKAMLRDDGELVPVSEHRAGLAEMGRMVRDTLSSLADVADASLTLSPEVIELIDGVARKALEGLADEMAA